MALRPRRHFVFASALCVAFALLAGCGPPTPEASAPALPAGSQRAQLLQLQAENKLPSPIEPAVLRSQLRALRAVVRPHLPFRPTGGVAMWVADTPIDYLVGLRANGKTLVSAIDLSQNCYEPTTVKIDRSQNIWLACEQPYAMGLGPKVIEYDAAGNQLSQYTPACPPSQSCDSSYGFDAAFDGNGAVFASIEYEYSGDPGTGIVFWASPSTQSSLLTFGAYCDPICAIFYLDVDGSDNVYLDYESFSSLNSGYGVAEVTNARTYPQFVDLLPQGSLEYPGGVYLSNHNTVLNVIDQGRHTISQYRLAPSFNATPFNVMKTKPNGFGISTPVSGAFNASDTKFVDGNARGWLDLCEAATDACGIRQSLNVVGPYGAAYTPSDK